ncbi:MAG: hypothetical protein KDD34_00400 [Bdellovibrionales bacterium]|nr:hypothetical protein [Bdellovibrionales bacterium]
MQIYEQAYGGKIFRPTPEVHLEDDGSLCIIATPWGGRSSAKKAIEVIVDTFLSSHTDLESTTPFEKDLSISPTANHLRAATLLANQQIYAEINTNEYHSGCELFVCAKIDNELSIIQTGQPQVFLAKKSLPIVPLATAADLSTCLSPNGYQLPPLPNALMGLEKTIQLNLYTYPLSSDCKVILLSRSFVPPRFLSVDGSDVNIELLVDTLIKQDESMPFWLGVIQL